MPMLPVRPFFPLLLLAAVAACSSPGATGEGVEGLSRATLYLRQGPTFELVSDAEVDRAEFYSQKRGNANSKVADADEMGALEEYLDEVDFLDRAQTGPFETRGAGDSLEVEWDGRVLHFTAGAAAPVDDRKYLQELQRNFLALYNLVDAYQSVRNESGGSYFYEEREKLLRKD